MAFTGTISHESTGEPPKEVLEAAVHCAEQVRAQKDAHSATRLMKSFELPDGYQAYVLDMEHVWRIHLIPPLPVSGELPEDEFSIDKELYPSLTIAGMISGAAKVTTLDFHQEDGEGGIRPWSDHYIKNDMVELMPETSDLFTRYEASYKVGVRENAAFAPFRGFTELTFSQFATIEPGNYTGGMSSIIQILLGVGKLLDKDYEDRWVEADPDNRFYATLLNPEELGLEEGEQPISFYNNKATPEVMITYDWRWNRTHGVMWGTTNTGGSQAMLVELGQRGVYVMPFPVDELSVLPEIQDQYLRVYPDLGKYTPFRGEQQTLFEAFNGFPTGKRMHGVIDELHREIRAGYVMQADRDLEDFYAGFGMSTGFGWAFNDNKPTAINTGVRYNELGQKVGYCYEIRLRMDEKPEDQKVRNTVAAGVIAALGLTEEIDLFKAPRLPQDFAESMIESPDYGAFDAFEVTPDWTIVAEIAKVREGVIEYPGFQCTRGPAGPCGIIIGAPHFKYYEPAIGAVLNFDFEKAEGVPTPKRSDGPIFATYVNGSAEILSYFWEPNEAQRIIENTRQYCQYVGSWEISDYSEGSGLVGYFYTSSKDFRKYHEIGGGTRRIVKGARHGDYDFMSFCAFFAMNSVITKRFVGSESWEGETWNSAGYNTSISCASNNRSMFFACSESVKTGVKPFSGFSGFQGIGSGGAVRYGSLYNFIFHWTGACRTDRHLGVGSPPCVMVNSPSYVVNPDSCHGTSPPGAVTYSVCCVTNGKIGGCYAKSHLVVRSPTGGVIQSAPVTSVPNGPPGWSQNSPDRWEYEYEVWAFGHPLMHNRRIRREKEVVTEYQLWTPSLSDSTWWRCSIPGECPAYPWRVVANYYGPAYVGTNEEFGFGWVEYGRKPQVGGRFFGVVS